LERAARARSDRACSAREKGGTWGRPRRAQKRRDLVKSVVIAGYARSPFHFAKKGARARVRPDELCAQVISALIERTKVDPADIEDVIVGCAMPEGEQGLNVARLVSFLAHLPITAAGTTVNRFCGSSMQSIHMAAGAIQLDAGEAFICAGAESMARLPLAGFNPPPHPA